MLIVRCIEKNDRQLLFGSYQVARFLDILVCGSPIVLRVYSTRHEGPFQAMRGLAMKSGLSSIDNRPCLVFMMSLTLAYN